VGKLSFTPASTTHAQATAAGRFERADMSLATDAHPVQMSGSESLLVLMGIYGSNSTRTMCKDGQQGQPTRIGPRFLKSLSQLRHDSLLATLDTNGSSPWRAVHSDQGVETVPDRTEHFFHRSSLPSCADGNHWQFAASSSCRIMFIACRPRAPKLCLRLLSGFQNECSEAISPP
jgi:hypothetical protein